MTDPFVIKAQMPETAALAVAYQLEHEARVQNYLGRRLPEGECIDPLHLVMEDGNVEDCWFSGSASLLDLYPNEWAALPATRRLAEHLATLTEDQRAAVSEHYTMWYWEEYPLEAPQWFRDERATTPKDRHDPS